MWRGKFQTNPRKETGFSSFVHDWFFFSFACVFSALAAHTRAFKDGPVAPLLLLSVARPKIFLWRGTWSQKAIKPAAGPVSPPRGALPEPKNRPSFGYLFEIETPTTEISAFSLHRWEQVQMFTWWKSLETLWHVLSLKWNVFIRWWLCILSVWAVYSTLSAVPLCIIF